MALEIKMACSYPLINVFLVCNWAVKQEMIGPKCCHNYIRSRVNDCDNPKWGVLLFFSMCFHYDNPMLKDTDGSYYGMPTHKA